MNPSTNGLPTHFAHQTLNTIDYEGWQNQLSPIQAPLHCDNKPAEKLVQQALDVLGSGRLTNSVHDDAVALLLYAAQKMLVQEGCTTNHPFTFQGQTLHLNALHLTCCSVALVNENMRPTPSEIARCLKLLSEHRSVHPGDMITIMSKIPGAQGTFHTSQLPLSPVEQNMTKALIKSFESLLSNSWQDLDATLIDRETFTTVMDKATDQSDFPDILKKFRQAAQKFPGIRLALRTQPSLAFSLLFPGKQIGPATRPTDLHEQLTKKFAEADTIRLADECPHGKSEPAAFSKVLGPVFKNMERFGSRNAIQVPSCFEDIPCPADSHVSINGHSAGVHANVVSKQGPGLLIAAMQPVTRPRSATVLPADLSPEERGNVAKFLSMVASQNNPSIVDLRSATELNTGKGIDYCPQQVDKTYTFNNVSITTTSKEELGQNLQRFKVRIAVEQNPPVELKVVQYRGWSDHSVATPNTLRILGQLVCEDQQNGESVVTHCGAGVGRTGTVLAYAGLHQRLIAESQAEALFVGPDKSELKRQKLIEQIVTEVVSGRVNRGPGFVENVEQFRLLGETILEDVQNWKKDELSDSGSMHESECSSEFTIASSHRALSDSDFITDSQSSLEFTDALSRPQELESAPKSPVAAEITPATDSPTAREIEPAAVAIRRKPKSSSEPYSWVEETALRVPNVDQGRPNVTLHANRVHLIKDHTFTIAQEPKTEQAKWQHLHNIFNEGCDVLEFVSDRNRLAQDCEIPKTKGLSILNKAVLDNFNNPANYNEMSDIHMGNFQINDVRQTMATKMKNDCAVHVYQIDVTDKNTGTKKSIRHAQLFSEFKSNLWTKDRLKAMLELVDECKLSFKGLWLGSAAGIGRPSAWLMARHISHAVHNKQMNAFNYQTMIDKWIKMGRQQRSANFVHTTAQKKELLLLAEDLINQKTGRKIPEPSPKLAARSKKQLIFSRPIRSFHELVNWIKNHLKPAKT